MTNNNFEAIVKQKTNNLIRFNNKKDIVNCLREINNTILDYEMKIGNKLTICPIWVEAYYYNEDAGFKDEACHEKSNFPNSQFDFRLHKKQGFGGIDLYLGEENKNYYLSFLIKLALVKEGNSKAKLCSQIDIFDVITRINKHRDFKIKFSKTILNHDKLIKVSAQRVGIDYEHKPNALDCELASYWELEGKHRSYNTLKDKVELYCFKK